MTVAVLTVVVVALGVLWHMMPAVARSGLFFGVSVDPDFGQSPDGERILHRYRLFVWVATGVAVACVLGASATSVPFSIVTPAVFAFQLVACYLAVIRANRQTAAHAVPPDLTREADLGRRPSLIPGGAIAAVLPFLLFAGVLVYTYMNFEMLPERVPIHWGMGGPDRWVDRTPQNVFGFLLALVLVCLCFSVAAFGTARGMRRTHADGASGEAELRSRKLSVLLLLGLQYALLVPAVLPLASSDGYRLASRVALFWSAGIVLVVVWALGLAWRMGQGGNRGVQASLLDADKPCGDRTPDSCWKWGMFYYNRDDSSLVVEKRFGLGQTLNFANRWSWVVLVLLAAPVVVLVVFVR